MIYKFDSATGESDSSTFLEISSAMGKLQITVGDYNNDYAWSQHTLEMNDIDDMMVALTSLKNEIHHWKRENA